MSDTSTIVAERRTEFGKGAARRIRRADKVPAVLYGHGTDPLHLTLPGHDTMMALKQQNALLSVDVEGEQHLALAKDVQRDPIKRFIEHVDLVIVRRGEKVTVEVAVHLEGEAAAETIVTVEHPSLTVEAEATDIPESLVVSVEGVTAGTQIHASDVPLPAGTTLVSDPGLLVVNITQPVSEEQLESELAEAEAEVGIEHEQAAPQIGEAEADAPEEATTGQPASDTETA